MSLCFLVDHQESVGKHHSPEHQSRPYQTTPCPFFTLCKPLELIARRNINSTHKRSKSSALNLLRRKDKDKDKESRNDEDTVSEDGSHVSASLAARPITSQIPVGLSHTTSVKAPNSSKMSLSRAPSQQQQPGAPTTPARTSLIVGGGDRAGSTLEQAVRKFRYVEALKSGNTAAISKAIRETSENSTRASISSISAASAGPLDDTTVLHLAIQCAENDVVEYVLSDGSGYVDVNARDKDGNTPLHVAATGGRGHIVRLLLEQKEINDAIANNQAKLPLDVARNPDIFQQLQLSRTLFVQDRVKQVQDLVRKGTYETLGQVLEEPRVKTILDINSTELPSDPTTVQSGGTLLHEAARTKDTKLIQTLLLHGADPFQRDRKGKLPQDVTKDDTTRAMLKRSPAAVAAQRGIQEKAVLGHAASTNTVGPVAGGESVGGRDPTMKGYLKKWTNYRKGYQLRWFVLENGVLSYYKHQDDAENACRGAISMRIATLHMNTDEKTKFEIIGKSSVKYTLKANHEVEAKRWYWALNNAIQWMKDQAKEERKQKAHTAEYLRQAKDHLTANKSVDGSTADLQSESASITDVGRNSVQLSRLPSKRQSTSKQGRSRASTTGSVDDEFVDAAASDARSRRGSRPLGLGEDDDDDDDDDSESGERPTASKDAFNITAQSAKLQLDTLAQVSNALQVEANRNPNMSLVDPRAAQALATYDAAIKSLKGLTGDLLRISKDRDAHWQYRLDQEIEMRQMWEESMAKVAQEQEVLEERVGKAELKHKRTKKALREVMEQDGRPGSAYSFGAAHAESSGSKEEFTEEQKSPASILRRPTALSQVVDLSDGDHTDEDEFFDAVDAGEVEVGKLPPVEASQQESQQEVIISGGLDISDSYKGYENGIRHRLKLDNDDRPKISLWVRNNALPRRALR